MRWFQHCPRSRSWRGPCDAWDSFTFLWAATGLSFSPRMWGRLATCRPSLELAMDATTPIGACDGGMSCVYETSLSWSSPTTPLPTEANPRVVFERLFGDGGSAADQLSALRDDRSLIDWLHEDIAH